MFIYGNSLQSTLVAVLILNPVESEKLGLAAISDELEKKKSVLKIINTYGKSQKLKGFEMIRACVLETEPFTVRLIG